MTLNFQADGHEIRVSGRLLRIAQLEGDFYVFLDDPAGMIKALATRSERIDIFTFIQRLPDITPKYPYHVESDNMAVLSVTTFDDWWKNQIRSEARNRARQAERKGVVLRESPFNDELVRGIWQIYNEVPVRQGRRFPHYGKGFETVYRDEATFLDTSFFIGAYFEDELIGFVKLTCDATWTQANLMNIVSMVSHRDKAPTNALIAHSVRACAQRGIRYLVYQQYSYGNKQRDGIMRFKEVNGFRQVDIPRYYVPLTPLGSAALRLGFHQRMVTRLPAGLADKLRTWRTSWLNRSLLSGGESA